MRATERSLITLCICTYHREMQLKRLLDSVAAQQLEPEWQVEVIVVDNDAKESARHVVDAHRVKASPVISVQYAVEPVQGISYARNHAVTLARGKWIAFLDDDEYVVEHWLKDMLTLLVAGTAAGVLGPVVPEFPPGSRSWAIKSRLFDRPRFSTGVVVNNKECRTGNVLLRGEWLRRYWPNPFNIGLAQSGGEDAEYFMRATRDGATFVWCDTAIAYEGVPLNRQSVASLLCRRFHASAVYWRLQSGTLPAPRRWGLAMLGAAGAALYGIVALILLPLGLHNSVRSLVKSASGLGRVALLWRFKIVVYHPKA